MGIQVKQLYRAFQLYQKSGKLGDFALLKADALGAKANPNLAPKLAAVTGYYPEINIEQLLQYPPGTFGREYAEHLTKNHLKPFNVSPELDAIAQRNVFALRYAVTHDIFHCLLGFDTSYAGEIGVLAFAAAQNYSHSLQVGLTFAKLLYPILAPRQRGAIWANLAKGQELGKQADFLLGYRFEDHWHEPIAQVRQHLGLRTTVEQR
ncbi:ubiquinone biosynthesis protein COQ4 [Laspinema sp. D1]|uniref:Ubiquinone biosynthesis protein COQ4 n=1 Tax=Laspinema palackyanum D2a TaxID=2953684 RepID=A0ABT2MKV4_9CYAN|nr:ubiquinone biosynthesis protein COQ4 [Laspinema sp. D2b]MCT7965381.1 ubiquinone biosynthesis protein COQ4 [Laspinema sp. D2a]